MLSLITVFDLHYPVLFFHPMFLGDLKLNMIGFQVVLIILTLSNMNFPLFIHLLLDSNQKALYD